MYGEHARNGEVQKANHIFPKKGRFFCPLSICNAIGDWYIVGDTYVGTAPIVGYSGGNGTGSFVTDNWTVDRKTYTPVSGYSYTVNSDTSIKDITRIDLDYAITEARKAMDSFQ